jgi:hypothetical protein
VNETDLQRAEIRVRAAKEKMDAALATLNDAETEWHNALIERNRLEDAPSPTPPGARG